MTIKRFISVKNVGRLVNCGQRGLELNRYNLFFAENGRGKTTLCAVLRSLQTGQHEHITERKSIGLPGVGEPSASLRLAGANATYGKNSWNTSVREIAIFDATFVARNVHSGEYVSRDHRSNLLQVIVGEAGVTLADAVNKHDDAIRDKNGEINRAKKTVQSHLPGAANLEAFLGLASDADIDAKIAAKTTERDAAKQAGEIKQRAALAEVTVPALPADMVATLARTLAGVSADAEKRLKEHIARHEMHGRGEAWTAEGLGYLSNDACPFCGQDTKGLALVEAYKQFFSEEYVALTGEIAQLRRQVEAAFGDAALAGLGRTIATNDAGAQFWKQFTTVALTSPDYDKTVVGRARKLREAALALTDAKAASPLTAIAPSADFETTLREYSAIGKLLGAYNAGVAAANTGIALQKKQAQTANLAAAEKELANLHLVKLRHDATIALLCDDYNRLAAEKAKLDKDKETAKEALDNHADTMIRDYEATINKLLKGFGAGFTITNSRKTYIGGTPTSVYQILINNHPVDLGDGSTPAGQPCFRTTLSAGDKSTLALAFFLAQLDHDPNKAKRIVVFDDPFNSQDRSRRERTAELLRKYGQDCAQLLLFSHDPFFLSLVYSKLPKAERHSLQLSRAPDNTTTIEEWDVEKETQEGYFKDHAALSSYTNSTSE